MTTADASYTRPTERTDWAPWEEWMEGHKNLILDAAGEVIGETVAGLEKRIKVLELELAQTRGALDVLRGKGVPGCFHVRGTFDGKSVYNYLDVVAFNGSSWVAVRDNPGDLPGPGWQLLSSVGKRGVAGERGPAGPAGTPPTWTGACFNRQGMEIETSAGPVPILRNVTVDAQDFSLKFTAPDGSTLKISLLPLFEAYHRQTTP
jgi:hypothetical protein